MLKFLLFLHVISAIFWIGGMLFLTLVIAPYLMTIAPKEKSKLYQTLGKKFRLYGWISIVILLVTGPAILYMLYDIPLTGVFGSEAMSTGLGKAVAIKVALVMLIVASSFFHDFWLGPKARNMPNFSRYAKIFGRGNLIVALLIAIFAVIIRGGGL